MHKNIIRGLFLSGLFGLLILSTGALARDSDDDRSTDVSGTWFGSFSASGFPDISVMATLARDGSMSTVDGTDFQNGFQSATTGAWTRQGGGKVVFTLIALEFDAAGNPSGTRRTRGTGGLDATGRLRGRFQTDYFQLGQDPLDRESVPYRSVTADFVLRRIRAGS